MRDSDAPDSMHEVRAAHPLPLEVRRLLPRSNGDDLQVVDEDLNHARMAVHDLLIVSPFA